MRDAIQVRKNNHVKDSIKLTMLPSAKCFFTASLVANIKEVY